MWLGMKKSGSLLTRVGSLHMVLGVAVLLCLGLFLRERHETETDN